MLNSIKNLTTMLGVTGFVVVLSMHTFTINSYEDNYLISVSAHTNKVIIDKKTWVKINKKNGHDFQYTHQGISSSQKIIGITEGDEDTCHILLVSKYQNISQNKKIKQINYKIETISFWSSFWK